MIDEEDLKTLETINFIACGNVGEFSEELKKEAIKWYKFFDQDYQDLLKYRKNHLKSAVKGRIEQCLEEKLEFIKDFFDITKEDLK